VGAGLSAKKMEGFEYYPPAPFGVFDAEHRRYDRAIAVSPKNCAIYFERVEHSYHFLGRARVKIYRPLVYAHRTAVTRAVGNNQTKLFPECLDLSIERVYRISPASMEEYKRGAASEFAVIDPGGARAGKQRRLFYLDEWQSRFGSSQGD
jgi:hypothetical protein